MYIVAGNDNTMLHNLCAPLSFYDEQRITVWRLFDHELHFPQLHR